MIDSHKILKYSPFYQPNEKFTGFKLFIDGEEVSDMMGYKMHNQFLLTGINVRVNFAGKGMGEALIIQYLKKYGGTVFSKGGRMEKSEKMWGRIIKRDDVNVEVLNITDRFKSYKVSLK